ncbi:MAG: phage major capsid protein [Bacillota bacterium]
MGVQARLAEIAARKIEIRSLLEKGEKIELEKIEEELKALEVEEKELRKRLDIAKGIEAGTVETRVVAATKVETPENRAIVDKYDTPEYRKAFMDYVTRGVKSEVLEFRADAVTGLGDIGAVIPTTILNRIVEKMEDVGRIWSRVTKTSVQGGVQIPVSTAKPTATWVAAGTMSDKQKKATSGTISFAYHKLQCRVSVELVAGTVAMPVFEATVSNNIAEAMVKALEEAIVSGTGVGEPLGITKDTGIPAGQTVDMAVADVSKYKTWATLMGKVPRAYRSGVVLIMNDADWNTHIVGMVDNNGQPIARVTYGLDGTIQERFLGREVIPTDLLPSIDTAAGGDVVAILVRLDDYMVNSNMAITYRRYFDENTDEWISKSTMIADGKLADPNGVVLIKKPVA